MINRALIRVKVVQMMYNYYLSRGTKTPTSALEELALSFESSYEVYNDLLQLIVDLTRQQELNLDEARYKYMPSDEDLNPNMRFVENELARRLHDDATLHAYLKEHPYSWRDNEPLLRLVLDKVLKSEAYRNYMEMPTTDFKSDCMVWRSIMKEVILQEENLLEEFQARSIYVGEDDFELMGEFVIKTLRRFENGEEHPLMPAFKDEDDEHFASDLLAQSIDQMDENNALIDSLVAKGRWASDRVAVMDRAIMIVAIAELRGFESIPTTVTLNEYIELAKSFSTLQSGTFVNGVLMGALNHLRADGSIRKP